MSKPHEVGHHNRDRCTQRVQVVRGGRAETVRCLKRYRQRHVRHEGIGSDGRTHRWLASEAVR